MASGGKKGISEYVKRNSEQMVSGTDAIEQKYEKIIEKLEKYKLQVRKRYGKDYEELSKSEVLKAAYKFGEITMDELKAAAQEAGIKMSDVFGSKAKAVANEVGSKIGSALEKINNSKIMTSLQDGVSNYIGMYDQYVSSISTRLIGLQTSYDQILETVEKGVGISRYTTVYNVLTNLNNYVQKGILNNIEQRAFLASVSDRIATTFDAFDSSLLTLIKLNREDSTQAYLGMEAALTEFLNTGFLDSSYMSDLSASVGNAITQAVAMLGTEMGAELQFQTEKWLGSFYASGASSEFITSLATAVNNLATGNVTALTSNESMNALFASAANIAGLNYGELLTGGVDARDINLLLQGVYQQVVSIASSTDNVAKQQLGEVFGVGIQDMIALQNITNEQLESLVTTQLNYSQMMQKTVTEIGNIGDRTGLKTQFDNMLDNALARIGENVATNQAAYITYSLADILGDITINVPFLGEVNLTGAVKSGIIGISTIASVIEMLSEIGSEDFIDTISKLQTTDVETSGTGMISGVGNYTGAQGITKDTNTVIYAGNVGTSDLLTSSLAGTKDTVETVTTATGADETTETIDKIHEAILAQTQLMEDLLGGSASDNIVGNLKDLGDKLDLIAAGVGGSIYDTGDWTDNPLTTDINEATLPGKLDELITIARRIEANMDETSVLSSV